MNDLAYLSTLTPEAFEAERCKLIANEILKGTPEQRKTALLLQMELDQIRDKVSPQEFMAVCFRRANENLENIADQFVAIGHSLGMKPTV